MKKRQRSMTPKENIISLFKNQSPEWIPWVPIINLANSPSCMSENIRSLNDNLPKAQWLYENIGCDIQLCFKIMKREYLRAEVSVNESDYATITKYNIDGKELFSSVRTMTHGKQISFAIDHYPIQDYNDLDIYEMLIDSAYDVLDIDEFKRLSEGLGDIGIITPIMPISPVMGLIIDTMGFELFTYAMADRHEQMARIIAKLHSLNTEAYKLLLEADLDVEIISSFEDSSSLLVTMDIFKQYIYSHLKQYGAACHSAGKKFMVHNCGHVDEFLDLEKEGNIDAHHYLTRKPLGNVDFKDVRNRIKEKMIIMASIYPPLLESGSNEDVKEEVIDMLKIFQSSKAFILMSGLKPSIPSENLMVIKEVWEQHRFFK